MPYEIWFLQGDMSREERGKVNKHLRPAFRDAFCYVADQHPFLKSNYVLQYSERCDEDFFVARWLDSDTAGIFFVGHSGVEKKGYPRLYHPSIDYFKGKDKVEEPAEWPVLDPKNKEFKKALKGGNKNLCMLVFMNCYSESLKKDWEALVSEDCWVVAFPDTTSGRYWLERRDRWGAIRVFESLLYRGPAGPEPKPKKKESIWEIRCNLASPEQARGPIGREPETEVILPPRPGPLGLA